VKAAWDVGFEAVSQAYSRLQSQFAKREQLESRLTEYANVQSSTKRT